jgi:hypothetical protein
MQILRVNSILYFNNLYYSHSRDTKESNKKVKDNNKDESFSEYLKDAVRNRDIICISHKNK